MHIKPRIVIIDGYNATKNISAMAGKERISLERSRDELVRRCAQWKAADPEISEIRIIFDGRSGVSPDRWPGKPGITPLFPKNRSADEEIIVEIERLILTSEVTVVTNDREIQRSARALGAKVKPVMEFDLRSGKKIEKARSSKHPKDGDEDEKNPAGAKDITEELLKEWGERE
jgi:predicted RNA-binding protein with PIN domain